MADPEIFGRRRRRGLRKSRRQKIAIFNRHLQISEIMGARNFNFAPKFAPNGFFSAQFLHFWTKISRQEKMFGQFSDSPKLRGDCPPSCILDRTALLVGLGDKHVDHVARRDPEWRFRELSPGKFQSCFNYARHFISGIFFLKVMFSK